MSTKIFNGYKINLEDGETLFDLVKKVRAALEPVYMEQYGRLMGAMACCFADAWERGEEMVLPGPAGKDRSGKVHKVGAHPLVEAMQVLEAYKKEISTSGQRNPGVDLSCDVAFLEDPSDKGVYALFYSEQREYTTAWESLSEVAEYGYWNNTDPPENMSDEEWVARSQTWERAMNLDEPPSRLGLCWELLGSTHHASIHYMIHREDLVQYLPSVAERARMIARREASRQMDAKREVDLLEETSDIYRILNAERPELDRITDELVLEIESTLKPRGTSDLIELSRVSPDETVLDA
jgi:hypothetical protein